MSLVKNTFIAIAILCLWGCASVYTVADFDVQTAQHRSIAILPFGVTIAAKNLPEELTQADLREQEKDEGYVFQRQMYTQFLQRYARGEYTVSFQDIDTTNVMLDRAGVKYEDLYKTHTRAELASMLGVDAIVSGTISRSRPMGNWSAIAVGLFTPLWGATNEVNASLMVHSGNNGDLLWSYDHEVSGSLGSSAEGISERLMKGVAKSFPYNSKKR